MYSELYYFIFAIKRNYINFVIAYEYKFFICYALNVPSLYKNHSRNMLTPFNLRNHKSQYAFIYLFIFSILINSLVYVALLATLIH